MPPSRAKNGHSRWRRIAVLTLLSWHHNECLGQAHGIKRRLAQWKRIHLPVQKTQEVWVQSLGQEDPPGAGNGDSFQYSCLENSMDRGAWRAIATGSQSWTRLKQVSMHTHTRTTNTYMEICNCNR